MREGEIETHLCWAVERAGGLAYKFKSPNNRGVSDRIVILPGGSVWFVELKTAKGRRSPLQVRFSAELKRRAAQYALLSSTTEVEAWLDKALMPKAANA